jgi:uncharacterized protein
MGTAENLTGKKQIREFQVFIKPVGPWCNLDCVYCYYLEKSELFGKGRHSCMDDELLEVYIKQHIEASTEQVITFSWHGGEPLLAGIDFYRKAVALQKKWCPPQRKIINGIQTNGTLIDEAWCKFFADEQFVVGISMDGPEELHNRFRKAKDGTGTYRRTLRGYDLLVLHGIEPEILCVVSAENAGFPLDVYRFLKQLGASFLTFIPLVERTSGTAVSERTVMPEAFGKYLCAVFDEWLAQDIGNVKIQIFEEALRTAFNQEHTLCIFKPECGAVPVVEHNGDFYSCDHFVNSQHRLGNVMEMSLSTLLDSERQIFFGKAKRQTLPEYCRQCEVLDMCNGECPKNRFVVTPGGEPDLNYLCAGYRMFFNHSRPFANAVAEAYSRNNR